MFTAKVYKVMVGSLSGTMEEVFASKETIRRWNLENAERAGNLYLLTDWLVETDNLQDVDIVIGVVGNWIENTAFIDDCIKEGRQVILFFNAFQDPSNTMPSERDTVKAFITNMQPHCFCAEYNNITDLSHKLNDRLA